MGVWAGLLVATTSFLLGVVTCVWLETRSMQRDEEIWARYQQQMRAMQTRIENDRREL